MRIEAASERDSLDPRRWQALAVCICALALTLLDLSVANVALPSIGGDLGATASQLQWVISGYALSIGVVPIIAGRLGDDHGRRRMLLIGIAGFVVTSLAVGAAPAVPVLLAARVVQGLAGGLINPQISGLIQQLFPPHERGRAFGAIGSATGVFTAAGPVVGGVLIYLGGDHLGWRLCFLINVPLGLVALVLCWVWVPRSPRSGPRPSLDLVGAGLLALGTFCTLFPFIEFDADRDPWLVLGFIPAVAALTGFLLWERGPAARRGYPLVNLALLDIRSFSTGLGIGFLFFCGFSGTGLLLALFLQEGLGQSAVVSGLTVAAYAVGTAVGALAGGRLVSGHGMRVLIVGLAIFVTAVAINGALTGLLAGRVSAGALIATMVPVLFVGGLGGGCVVAPNQALCLADLRSLAGSVAGGMVQTAQRLGYAIGGAVVTVAFYTVAAHGPSDPSTARSRQYGWAYATGLLTTVVFGLAALSLAVSQARATRREFAGLAAADQPVKPSSSPRRPG